MRSPTNLDIDVLRTFVLGFELGSFARAADHLGRSPSAVSTQLRRLESQMGHPLVRRVGRGLVPTDAGRELLSEARRLVDLNDAVVERLRGVGPSGRVTVGLTQDLADALLPTVLARFVRVHPAVRIEVVVDRSGGLRDGVARGDIDIALGWGDVSGAVRAERIATIPMVWIGAAQTDDSAGDGSGATPGEPIALALLEAPCVFREAAIEAIEATGAGWRVAVSSPSVSGLFAATSAGLAITARTFLSVPRGARIIAPTATGLPELPTVAMTVIARDGRSGDAVGVLEETLRDAVTRLYARWPNDTDGRFRTVSERFDPA